MTRIGDAVIENIVFDMGQVLIHWTPDMFMDHYPLSGEDRELLRRELFATVEWVRLDRGSITEEQALAQICARLPERLHDVARELVCRWWVWPFRYMEGMEALIRELKAKGYSIYLLSNAGLPLREYFSRLPAADCFSGKVISSEERVIKPQPEIYRILLSRYGLESDSCVFIDDLPVNCEGAVEQGMHAVVFRGDVSRLRKELRSLGIRCEG